MKKLSILIVMLLSAFLVKGQFEFEIVTSDDGICIGDIVDIGVENQNVTFKWTSNPPGFYSSNYEFEASPDTTTTYILEIFENGVQIFKDSTTIDVYLPITPVELIGDINCINNITLSTNSSEIGVVYKCVLFPGNDVTGFLPGTGEPLVFGNFENGLYYLIAVNGWTGESYDGCYFITDGDSFYSNIEDSICLVTVDTTINKNIIVWETTDDNRISHHNVYRDGFDDFELIGSLPYNSTDSVVTYVDMTSNPTQRSYTYKISVVDTCGNEIIGYKSHKTIHLMYQFNEQQNYSNLEWSDCEGVDFSRYYLYRKINNDIFTLIDSVPNSITSYTDINPPVGDLSYMIGVDNVNGCLYDINSNVKISALGNDEIKVKVYNIFPNPTSSKFTIIGISVNDKIILTDMFGNSINVMINGNVIDMSNLSSGMYILYIKGKSGIYSNKIIKN